MTISKACPEQSRRAVAALTVALAIASYWFLPHADFPNYGNFADDAVSTFRNVVSNAALLVVGVAGVWWSMRHRLELADDYPASMSLFAGLILTAFGSAYFHATPLNLHGELNRFQLLWDRMPITVGLAGMFALVLRDRVFPRPNRIALPLLVIAGIATTLYWYWTRDLWPYAFFQFYAAAGTLLLIMTLRPSFTEAGYVAAAVFMFGISKVFEDFDHQIHAHWGIGGHPLKHVAGAIAALMILVWLRKRRARA